MRLKTQFPADLVTFTEKILNEKLHFLCSVTTKRDRIVTNLDVLLPIMSLNSQPFGQVVLQDSVTS